MQYSLISHIHNLKWIYINRTLAKIYVIVKNMFTTTKKILNKTYLVTPQGTTEKKNQSTCNNKTNERHKPGNFALKSVRRERDTHTRKNISPNTKKENQIEKTTRLPNGTNN